MMVHVRSGVPVGERRCPASDIVARALSVAVSRGRRSVLVGAQQAALRADVGKAALGGGEEIRVVTLGARAQRGHDALERAPLLRGALRHKAIVQMLKGRIRTVGRRGAREVRRELRQ